MANGKRQSDGLLSAWHLAGILARMPFTAISLRPGDINPFRDGPAETSDAMAALKKWQAKREWEIRHRS